MDELQQKLNISFDDFEQWIDDNTPDDWTLSDMVDFMAYLGYCYFHQMRVASPFLTVNLLAASIFGEGQEKQDAIDQIIPLWN
jgi:hypothetical protein